MEEQEEKDKGFKVQDRRRFSAEGEAKPGAEEETTAESGAEAKSGQTSQQASQSSQSQFSEASRPSQGSQQADSQFTTQSAAGRESAKESATKESGEPELSFATFIVGLSTEALAALGEMPDPATGKARRDLRAAQQLIDILALLREKTRGNLDQNESRLMEAILFDLRMKYVEIVKQPAR